MRIAAFIGFIDTTVSMHAIAGTMPRRLALMHLTKHPMCHTLLHSSSLEACQNQLYCWLSYSYCCTAMLFSSCSFPWQTAAGSCAASSLKFGKLLNFCLLCWMKKTFAGGGRLRSALLEITSFDLNACLLPYGDCP